MQHLRNFLKGVDSHFHLPVHAPVKNILALPANNQFFFILFSFSSPPWAQLVSVMYTSALYGWVAELVHPFSLLLFFFLFLTDPVVFIPFRQTLSLLPSFVYIGLSSVFFITLHVIFSWFLFSEAFFSNLLSLHQPRRVIRVEGGCDPGD